MKKHQRRLVRTAAAWLVAIALFAASGVSTEAFAESTKDRARSHYLKGKTLYDQANYKSAIAEFAAADGLAPSALLEFNIALCYEKLGDPKEAVRRYRVYLDRDPNADNRSAVESKVKQLQAQVTADADRARRKAEEKARKAEEARKAAEAAKPVPPPVGAGPTAPPTTPPANGPPPTGTGDPAIDRVNRIDIASIRDERRGNRAAQAGSVTPPPNGPPPKRGGGVSPPPPSKDRGGSKKSKPIYKEWWFWVVVGVSAVILIDIASSDSSNAATRMAFPDGVGAGRSTSAPVLLRF